MKLVSLFIYFFQTTNGAKIEQEKEEALVGAALEQPTKDEVEVSKDEIQVNAAEEPQSSLTTSETEAPKVEVEEDEAVSAQLDTVATNSEASEKVSCFHLIVSSWFNS